ncbi:MAG: threonine ammonia-lyase, biosynthetic [Pseudomonadota bacterium]|uniref:threonine ammonia-lyase, biosynthetic n=1 Tax=Aquabacterium sp. TaxID=1872578 RepID=UPI001D915958|nr:threonine ammonia-lyase, biosynthetic [Aquabacterium sp.]MBT9611380.1 threonine ammonia-lyase, biosynthetic [Aquabacterium sp.]
MPTARPAAPRKTAQPKAVVKAAVKASSKAPAKIPVPLSIQDYLRKILTSHVYDVAIESPLDEARSLSRRLGHHVFFKREDKQPVFSFKLRGAYNKMAGLSKAQLAKGVICASAGNHAQGVALGAKRLGCQATIVMPTTTPQVKIDAVRHFGGDHVQIVLHGESYSDAALHAKELERKKGMTFVHPFDDPDVIAGQGTVAMEILRQHAGPIDAIFVAIGGGGLISGVAAYVKAVRPEVKVIGVQMSDSDAMVRSVKAGERVTLSDVGLFSDGTAVKLVGEETLRLTRELVDDIVTVNTDAVCAAIKDIYQDTRSIVEPAGALGVAALKQYAEHHGGQGKTYIAINCGANMNFDRLRFVAERAEVGEEREALLAVTIPEERGSFKRFCETVGPRSVTEFNYRISDEKRAHVFVGLSTKEKGESRQIAKAFKAEGFATVDLTHDELAKTHIRHMVGGRSPLAAGERLYSFIFPERPGALMGFLTSLPPGWNISLFHYRNQGADYGRILVGLQVPEDEAKRIPKVLDKLGYVYVDETRNPVYQLFLR